MVRIINAVLEWYSNEIAIKTKTKADEQFLPIFKKAAYGVVGIIILLWLLGQMGVEITTLVAAMGIGGLAVALALQGTPHLLSVYFETKEGPRTCCCVGTVLSESLIYRVTSQITQNQPRESALIRTRLSQTVVATGIDAHMQPAGKNLEVEVLVFAGDRG